MRKQQIKRLFLLALCLAVVPFVIEAGELTEKSGSFEVNRLSHRGPYFNLHKITVVAIDGDPSDDYFDIDFDESRWLDFWGAGLQMLVVKPGTGTEAPLATFNLQLHDGSGGRLLSYSEIATNAETVIAGNYTLGLQAPMQTSRIRISSATDWGDTGDEIALWFYTFQRRY